MDENAYKSRGWKDTTKRDRTPTWQWIRKMVNKAYTSEEWVEMFKQLPDRDKWRILQDVNPVPKEIRADSSVSVRFEIVRGGNPIEIEGKVVDLKALTEGDE